MNLPLKKEPPLPNPLLHQYVEEREMERRSRVHVFNARMLSGKSLPALPPPLGGKRVAAGRKRGFVAEPFLQQHNLAGWPVHQLDVSPPASSTVRKSANFQRTSAFQAVGQDYSPCFVLCQFFLLHCRRHVLKWNREDLENQATGCRRILFESRFSQDFVVRPQRTRPQQQNSAAARVCSHGA